MTNISKKELLQQIGHCDEFINAMNNPAHPCYEIVNSQKVYFDSTEDYHIPEAWNGNIETAQILFISSNPSIDIKNKEGYPTVKDKIDFEYFENRLLNAYKTPNWVIYWTYAKKWASWILPEMPEQELISNIALTEVVHCKSTQDKIIKKCKNLCSEKWLNHILKIFNGNYIVVVGSKARICFDKIVTDNKDKIVIYTPHYKCQIKGFTDEVRRQQIKEQLSK